MQLQYAWEMTQTEISFAMLLLYIELQTNACCFLINVEGLITHLLGTPFLLTFKRVKSLLRNEVWEPIFIFFCFDCRYRRKLVSTLNSFSSNNKLDQHSVLSNRVRLPQYDLASLSAHECQWSLGSVLEFVLGCSGHYNDPIGHFEKKNIILFVVPQDFV